MQNDDFLRLKVPESQKNKEWYTYHADRLIPSAQYVSMEQAQQMDRLYKLMGNDLSGFAKEIAMYCGDLTEFGATEEELIPYNPLPTKIEQLKGMTLYRGNTYRLMLLNAKAIRDKDYQFREFVKESVDEDLQMAITRQEKEMEGMDDKQVDAYIEQLRTKMPLNKISRRKYLTQAEITFSKLIQYTESTQDVRSKKMDTIEDASIVARLFVANLWENGAPMIKVLNPKNVGFAKSPDQQLVQKGDFWWYRDFITLGDALDQYINELTDEQLKKLVQFGQIGNPVTKAHAERPVMDQLKFYSLLERLGESSNIDQDGGLSQGNHLTNMNFNFLVPRIRLEFKAYEEVIFLTYKNELGANITEQVSKKAREVVIPEYATKLKSTSKFGFETPRYEWTEGDQVFKAEIIYIPKRYEVLRLGQDIDVYGRKVPHQPVYDNPFRDFELSCKGMLIYNRNTDAISPVQRALPYVFQYMSARRVQNRELAKFVGQEKVVDIDQTPTGLARNHTDEDDPVLNQEIIARKTGTRFVSSSQTTQGLPVPNTRGKGVDYQVVDTTPILMNLDAFCNQIDRTIGLRMGITPSMAGNVESRTTAKDNEWSRRSSDLQTSSLFYAVDKVWSYVIDEHLRNLLTVAKEFFKENPTLEDYQMEVALPDGSQEFFKLTRSNLDSLRSIGLYHYDTGKEKLYFDYMLNSVFSFAQNAGEGVEVVSSVLKALTSTNSVEEMHEVIRQTTEDLRERTQQELQAQAEAQERIQKAQMEVLREQEALRLQGKLTEIDRKAVADLERARISSDALAKQYDIDKDGVNDLLTRERMKLDHETRENAKDRAHEARLAQQKQ